MVSKMPPGSRKLDDQAIDWLLFGCANYVPRSGLGRTSTQGRFSLDRIGKGIEGRQRIDATL